MYVDYNKNVPTQTDKAGFSPNQAPKKLKSHVLVLLNAIRGTYCQSKCYSDEDCLVSGQVCNQGYCVSSCPAGYSLGAWSDVVDCGCGCGSAQAVYDYCCKNDGSCHKACEYLFH